MYAQLFGNYLISNNLVTKDQLIKAMELASTSSLKLEAKLIHSGLVSGKDIESSLAEAENFGFEFSDVIVRDELIDISTLKGLDGYDRLCSYFYIRLCYLIFLRLRIFSK